MSSDPSAICIHTYRIQSCLAVRGKQSGAYDSDPLSELCEKPSIIWFILSIKPAQGVFTSLLSLSLSGCSYKCTNLKNKFQESDVFFSYGFAYCRGTQTTPNTLRGQINGSESELKSKYFSSIRICDMYKRTGCFVKRDICRRPKRSDDMLLKLGILNRRTNVYSGLLRKYFICVSIINNSFYQLSRPSDQFLQCLDTQLASSSIRNIRSMELLCSCRKRLRNVNTINAIQQPMLLLCLPIVNVYLFVYLFIIIIPFERRQRFNLS